MSTQDPTWVVTCTAELSYLRPYVVVTGEWAKHFASPSSQVDLDRSAVEILVPPRTIHTTREVLRNRGFLPQGAEIPTGTWYKKEGPDLSPPLFINLVVRDARVLQCPGGWLVTPTHGMR